jgi:hypothetical protein
MDWKLYDIYTLWMEPRDGASEAKEILIRFNDTTLTILQKGGLIDWVWLSCAKTHKNGGFTWARELRQKNLSASLQQTSQDDHTKKVVLLDVCISVYLKHGWDRPGEVQQEIYRNSISQLDHITLSSLRCNHWSNIWYNATRVRVGAKYSAAPLVFSS